MRTISETDAPSPLSVNKHIPERLAEITLKALTRDPEQRYTSAAELRAELAAPLDPLMRFVDLAAGIEVPCWAAQPTVYMALRPIVEGYRFRGESICTSRGEEFPAEAYREVVRIDPACAEAVDAVGSLEQLLGR